MNEMDEESVQRPVKQGDTTEDWRFLTMSPKDRLLARQLEARLQEIQVEMENADEAEALEHLLEEQARAQELLREVRTFNAALAPVKRRRLYYLPKCTTIRGAWEEFEHNSHRWLNMFIFLPEEIEYIHDCLFPGLAAFELGRKQGQMSTEEILLLTLARLRTSESSWAQLSWTFQRSESKLSTAWDAARTYYQERWGHLLDAQNMNRFQPHVAQWVQAVEQKVQETLGPDVQLPELYRGIGGFIDGVRGVVCRTRNHAVDTALHTGMAGYRTNFLWVPVMAPHGLYLCAPYANGRRHDSGVVNLYHIGERLEEIGLTVLGDAGFRNFGGIRRVPYDHEMGVLGVTQPMRTALSRMRSMVEVSFNALRTDAKIVDIRRKQKVFETRPVATFFTAVLFHNVRVCVRGTTVCEYFGVMPPSLENYLDGGA